jgi:hypothetical protein
VENKRIVYITIACLLAVTILALVYPATKETDKSKVVRLVLEDWINVTDARGYPIEGSLLIVETPILSDVNLPSEIDGLHVILITMEQVKAPEESLGYNAILFGNITLISDSKAFIQFWTHYGYYWPHLWNTSYSYSLEKRSGIWVITSFGGITLV